MERIAEHPRLLLVAFIVANATACGGTAAETTEGIQTAIRFISTATWDSTIYDQPHRGKYDRTPLEAFVRVESDPKNRP